MSELILHHYASSPFSEKVRLVLGLKGLAWRSVEVPVMMPKPDVLPLTGGYRRTPFLQIGADIYCDSALMCRVIDRLAPQPPLYPAGCSGAAPMISQWADSALFWVAVPLTIQRVANVERAQLLVESASRAALQRFLAAWQDLLRQTRADPAHKGLIRWAIDVDPLTI